MPVPGNDTVSYSRADLNLNLTVDAILDEAAPSLKLICRFGLLCDYQWIHLKSVTASRLPNTEKVEKPRRGALRHLFTHIGIVNYRHEAPGEE